jgi:hypothetical protein
MHYSISKVSITPPDYNAKILREGRLFVQAFPVKQTSPVKQSAQAPKRVQNSNKPKVTKPNGHHLEKSLAWLGVSCGVFVAEKMVQGALVSSSLITGPVGVTASVVAGVVGYGAFLGALGNALEELKKADADAHPNRILPKPPE